VILVSTLLALILSLGHVADAALGSTLTSRAQVSRPRTFTLHLPDLYGKQHRAIYAPTRFALIEAGTKTGKTLGCGIWLIDKAWNEGRPGDQYWWVAPVHGVAAIGYRTISALLPPEPWCKRNASAKTISLPNGATICFKSAEKPDHLFGERVRAAVIDEASRMRPEAWWAVRTTLTATRGPARIIGNPKGKKNWFYLWCQKVKLDRYEEGEERDATYSHLKTADCPYISPEEIAAARRALPAYVFAELYEGIAQDDYTGVFRDFRSVVNPDCLLSGRECRRLGMDLVAGLDIARIVNYTVLIIMERETRRIVHWDRFRSIGWPLQEARIKATLAEYGNPRLYMDSTGPGGDTFYGYLKREAEFNITGIDFGGGRKQNLIEALAINVEQKAIQVPDDETFIGEFDVFEYRVTPSGNVQYSAPDGYDDDIVCATALASWGAGRTGTCTI